MLLLITGASGVGKSTVRAAIRPRLAETVESVELTQLAPPTAMTLAWRQQTTEVAVRRAIELRRAERHLLLCGDPVPAAEIVAAPSADRLDAIAVCLLDVAPAAQAERLTARGDDPGLLPRHQAFADWMRRQAIDPLHMTHVISGGSWEQMRWARLPAIAPDWQMHTIDTTHLSREAVADAVLAWCRRALSGDAPTMRVTGSQTPLA